MGYYGSRRKTPMKKVVVCLSTLRTAACRRLRQGWPSVIQSVGSREDLVALVSNPWDEDHGCVEEGSRTGFCSGFNCDLTRG